MCTAIDFKTKDHYFGRNLDLEYSYEESITVTPRNYPFSFRKEGVLNTHYAMIGMAYVAEDYPLYYDATNEKGLSMAGLNFPDNAFYLNKKKDRKNICPFEFIPWILSQCATVTEVKSCLQNCNLVKIDFSEKLPLTPMHWMISDREETITVEPTKDGLKVYDNPVGVLTNNPPFPYQLYNLSQYLNLTRKVPENRFAKSLDLKPFSRGMGGIGIPGDLSSVSRFVRASFVKWNSVCGDSEEESVGQFFHILGAVCQQKGCVEVSPDSFEYTIYTSCCNTEKGIYYYKTYENYQIMAVDMRKENIDSIELISYPMLQKMQIIRQIHN